MYMDDIKLFAKKGKKLQILMETIRIYGQGIGMEFGMEKVAMLIKKRGKNDKRKKQNCQIKKESGGLEKKLQ